MTAKVVKEEDREEMRPEWCPDPEGCNPVASYLGENPAGTCGGVLREPWTHGPVLNSMRMCQLQELEGQEGHNPLWGDRKESEEVSLTSYDMSPLDVQVQAWVATELGMAWTHKVMEDVLDDMEEEE